MMLNDVTNSGRPRPAKKRLGRGPGSGTGKTAGKGHKGQQARSGYSRTLMKEGGQMPLFRLLPKRGFGNSLFRKEYEPVNVDALAEFEANATVGPEEMRKRSLARSEKPIKILGTGTLEKPLTVRAHKFSKSAIRKIEAAGGRAEVI